MKIGGLEKFTLIDYPGKVSAIIFTEGCNFRCEFCYNPSLVIPAFVLPQDTGSKEVEIGRSDISESDLFHFLGLRIGKLDGVVITGGEPTIHQDLPQFIRKIKHLGYVVKLDSNGTNPEMLASLIADGLIDYCAMDIKSSPSSYDDATGVKIDFNKIEKSVRILIEGDLPYEFRTTLVPGIHDENTIREMGKFIHGASRWYLQKFKSDTYLVNSSYQGRKAFTDIQMRDFAQIGSAFVKECRYRE